MTHNPPATKRTRALRNLLDSAQLEFIMEAHNGVSARIVEEAGFAGIWANGLGLSAAFGVRVDVVYIAGHWLDVNNLDDLRAAGDFTQGALP